MRCRLVMHRVLGLAVRPIFKSQMCPLNMEPIDNPEKSVLNHPTLHNIPEDHRIYDEAPFTISRTKA